MLLDIYLINEEWQRKQRELDRKFKHLHHRYDSALAESRSEQPAPRRWFSKSGRQEKPQPVFVNIQPETAEA